MKKSFSMLILLFVFFPSCFGQTEIPHQGFVYVKDVVSQIELDIRYTGTHNFVGKSIRGYEKPRAILTLPAAKALKKVQQEVMKKGYCIKIFDAYRPQQAVDHFIKWAGNPEDTLMKQEFYPEVDKKDLFRLGYIATKSGHSRGSTVDLTLVDCNTGAALDMGNTYDFFGEISHHSSTKISSEQKKNRELLKKVMMKYGFRPYSEEWWHYTLNNEPYPNTYFDFVVE